MLFNIAKGCYTALVVLGVVGLIVPLTTEFALLFGAFTCALIFWCVGFAVAHLIASRIGDAR